MEGLNKKREHLYCVCNNYKKNYKTKNCTPHSFNYLKLERLIKEELNKDLENIEIKEKNDELYYDMIKKINITEQGEVEMLLNYKSSLL